MKRLPTPAEMEARLRQIANNEAPAPVGNDSSTKSHLVSWVDLNQETKETKSLSSATNQEFKESLSAETLVLLERYGDIMGIVDNHPLFARSIRDWNVFPQALTQACKTHGVETVLDALRYSANYPAARNKAKFFWAVLRNGKRALR